MILAVSLGCASNQNGSGSASREGTEDPAAVRKTLDEWVAEYPLEGDSYMQSMMTNTYGAFSGLYQAAFGLEDTPAACASCHAREDFYTVYAAYGEDFLDDNASAYDMEWSNCTNCHVGDPGDGVVKGGNAYGEAVSASAVNLFNEDDYVCGQCHSIYPGAPYLEDKNREIDQYKYGHDSDSMLKAMREYFAKNEITSSTVDITVGTSTSGVPYYDENIGTTLYLTNSNSALELFQGGTHQSMGLSCVDCHMVKTTAADGATYTNHNMTASPLENPDALAKCLTCHKAQGIEDADAMVDFARDKMDTLGALQQQTEADLETFYNLLADAVSSGSVDGEALKAAQEAYVKATVYSAHQRGSNRIPNEGKLAAMNYDYSVTLLEKAEAQIQEGIASLR
jgi:nitrite reductase (cytochrome c-552)